MQMRNPIWELAAIDEPLQELSKLDEGTREEFSSRTRGRVLLAIKPGMIPPYFARDSYEVREIPYDRCPFSGNVCLVGARMYVFSTQTVGLGIIVENQEMVNIFRAMYDAIWAQAQHWKAPIDWEQKKKE